MDALFYMLSADESLSSFLPLRKKHINVRGAKLLKHYIVLHTAYSPFSGIFHDVWVIELMPGSIVLIKSYFYMPFLDI